MPWILAALGGGSAAVPATAGATGAAGATLGIPTGVGAAGTTGLLGTGRQLGLGGALPQAGLGALGSPPQQFGFDPRTIGFLAGQAGQQGQGQQQDPLQLIRQLLLLYGGQGQGRF